MTNQSQVTKQQDKFPIKTFFEMPVIKKKLKN